MQTNFFVACNCGGTSFSNHVKVDNNGYGEMVTLCLTCFDEQKQTTLCQEVVSELLAGNKAESIFV